MSDKIAISEIYGPVLQGEGPVAGRATIFVRVFGCDSRCEQCDSLYAVDPDHPGAKYSYMTAQEIVAKVNDLNPNLPLPVTFSGGNPAIWDLTETTELLQKHSHPVWVETQGTYWRDWLNLCQSVVISPKGPFMNDQKQGVLPLAWLEEFWRKIHPELPSIKVVIGSELDFDYADEIADRLHLHRIYLSVGCPLVGDGDSSTDGLLSRYADLTDLLLSDRGRVRWPRLNAYGIFLPQIHVLTHGQIREK